MRNRLWPHANSAGPFAPGRMTALALGTSQSGDDANDDLRIEVAGGDSHEARGCGDGLLT
jgi:hypothetical protein